jgi:hypothetical protein
MTIQDDRLPPDEKRNGPLSRLGQNYSFAGFSRISVVAIGVFLTGIVGWAGRDVSAMMESIRANQGAIVNLADRTTRIEETAKATQNANDKTQLWLQGQIQTQGQRLDAESQRIYSVEGAQTKLTSRVYCLEHKILCPQ